MNIFLKNKEFFFFNSYKTSYNLGVHLACQIVQKKVEFISIIASDKLLIVNTQRRYNIKKMIKSILASLKQCES